MPQNGTISSNHTHIMEVRLMGLLFRQWMSPRNTTKLDNQDNVVLKNEVTVKVEPSRLLQQRR